MNISSEQRDYHKYCWKRGERIAAVCMCAGLTGLLAYFFYRSLLAVIPLSGVGLYAFRAMEKNKSSAFRMELTAQFRECILAVSTLLEAGYSAENAFLDCRQDMALMYGEKAVICRELDFIRRGISVNIPLEELLEDIAARSGCDDITQFAQIFILAKRNGGNMAQIIKSSACQIGKRIELRREVQTLLAGRRMELGIMKGMPFGILVYVSMGSPGYFDALYHDLTGAAVMTGCLAVYLGAWVLGEVVMAGIMAEIG